MEGRGEDGIRGGEEKEGCQGEGSFYLRGREDSQSGGHDISKNKPIVELFFLFAFLSYVTKKKKTSMEGKK